MCCSSLKALETYVHKLKPARPACCSSSVLNIGKITRRCELKNKTDNSFYLPPSSSEASFSLTVYVFSPAETLILWALRLKLTFPLTLMAASRSVAMSWVYCGCYGL